MAQSDNAQAELAKRENQASKFTISTKLQTWSAMPASIAGVMRKVW
jgi:hypothetical protein